MAWRRFTNTNGNHHKFWEIESVGRVNTVRYGRIGTKGTDRAKVWYSSLAALRAADKLIGEKIGKGYIEMQPFGFEHIPLPIAAEPDAIDIPEGRMITFGDE